MNLMANAMMEAGLITNTDLTRVKKEAEKQSREEQERRDKILRTEAALSAMGGMRVEIEAHMRTYPDTISVELLEKWASEVKREKGYQNQHRVATRHWAMYLNFFNRQIQQVS